jgi:hypothetical protein
VTNIFSEMKNTWMALQDELGVARVSMLYLPIEVCVSMTKKFLAVNLETPLGSSWSQCSFSTGIRLFLGRSEGNGGW